MPSQNEKIHGTAGADENYPKCRGQSECCAGRQDHSLLDPFPREIADRQLNVKIIQTDPPIYILANTDQTLQRTIYFEKPAVKDSVTKFAVEYTYEIYGKYAPITAEQVTAIRPMPDWDST
jgi:hypothetical protein